MPIRDHNSKVTIEDLLRLKRTERPDAKFWANFEQELRQKQLTALVKKRRFWHEIPHLLSRRFYLPASAAAIVAFTLISVRHSVSPLQVAEANSTTLPSAVALGSVEMLDVIEVVGAKASKQRPLAESLAQVSESRTIASVPVAAPKQILANSPSVSQPANTARSIEARSGDAISASFVSLANLEPDLMSAALDSRLGSSAHAPKVGGTQSDMVVQSSAGPKYRLIARYADSSLSPEPMAPAIVRERLARRLGDDIGDNVSRIGVVGSRVSLKF